MIVKYDPIIAIVFALLSMSLSAETMSLRDVEYKKSHLKSLTARKGYQGSKDWDNFVPMAIKYEDAEILTKMLAVEPGLSATEYAEYVNDLYKVYKEKPDFFVMTAHNFYKKDLDCVVRTLKTNPLIIPTFDLEKVLNAKVKNKTLQEFEKKLKALDFSKEKNSATIKVNLKCDQIKKSHKT